MKQIRYEYFEKYIKPHCRLMHDFKDKAEIFFRHEIKFYDTEKVIFLHEYKKDLDVCWQYEEIHRCFYISKKEVALLYVKPTEKYVEGKHVGFEYTENNLAQLIEMVGL